MDDHVQDLPGHSGAAAPGGGGKSRPGEAGGAGGELGLRLSHWPRLLLWLDLIMITVTDQLRRPCHFGSPFTSCL